MIQVEIREGYKNTTKPWRITASGHADYAEEGKDIICAAVSTLIGTLALQMCEWETSGKVVDTEYHIGGKGDSMLTFWARDDGIDYVIDYLYTGLKALSHDYPWNVRVKRVSGNF